MANCRGVLEAQRRFEERFHPDRVMGEILEVYREAVLRAEVRRSKIEDRGPI
jgi:hypothetical protein